MPDAVDRPYEGDAVPEFRPAHGTDAPNLELSKGVSGGDNQRTLEPRDSADEGFGESDGPGYEPLGDGRDELDPFLDRAEAGEEQLPSREQVVGRARDLLAELDSAVSDGDTSKPLDADAQEAVREYATTQAVEFLRSVDGSAVFRNAPKVTNDDVEVVVKALRDAVQKVGLEEVLAIVAQLAGNRETLKTLLLFTDTSSAPTRVKDLARRFSSRGLLLTAAALMCAAGIDIALLRDAVAETALTNDTAIGALVAAVAALFKHPR